MKPKILIALFRLPYPATDGTRYKILNNVALGLVHDFDVEFFIMNIKKYDRADVEYLEKNFGKVHLFHHSKLSYVLNSFPAFFSGLPLQAQAFRFDDAKKWIDAHIHEYDAVYVHEIRMTELFIDFPDDVKQKFLIDFNDAISMNYAQGAEKWGFLKKMFYTWEGRRVARYESKVLESFFHFNIVSQVDKNYLLDASSFHGNRDIDFSVIHHGTIVSELVALRDEQKIFFMGSLDYEPNHDALRYFLEIIWPKLLMRKPDLELVVIGGGTVAPSWKKIKNVRFLGFVPNVFEVIKHCKALVAPIRSAGGTPSKIIEAMGYSIPVITTPSGAMGIVGILHEKNILVIPETDIEAWVSAVQRIIDDYSFGQTIGTNARMLAFEKYSSLSSQEAFRNRFNAIISK